MLPMQINHAMEGFFFLLFLSVACVSSLHFTLKISFHEFSGRKENTFFFLFFLINTDLCFVYFLYFTLTTSLFFSAHKTKSFYDWKRVKGSSSPEFGTKHVLYCCLLYFQSRHTLRSQNLSSPTL